jgi:surface antigen
MVLTNYAGPNHGHVAVVKRIVSSREIRIDHANWLNDGSIYVNNPVMDVSAANDWSQVRVFKIQTGRLGLQGLSGAGLYRVQQQSPAR